MASEKPVQHTGIMQWVLSIFRLGQRPPALREIPEILLKCVIWGAISGPFFALFFTGLANSQDVLPFLSSPVAIGWSCVVGVIFSIFFYAFCGPGNSLLRLWLTGFPPDIIGGIFVAYNAIACSLAFACSALVIRNLPMAGVHINMPVTWQVMVIEALLGAVLAVIVGAFIKLKRQVESTQNELAQEQIETARAQALALQSQINPHFFFNTLNSISALIDDDTAAAKRMIGRLADMFRYTLGCTHTQAVTLEQELQFVRDYLDIEQARFRQRLNVELPAGPIPAVRVPGLVLQPLVENAVKHGIAGLVDGGTVAIRLTQTGPTTRISVGNTADAHSELQPATMYRPGHALENVRARLRLFNGQPEPLLVAYSEEWTEFSFDAQAVAG